MIFRNITYIVRSTKWWPHVKYQIDPDTIASGEDMRMLLYRFYGVTKGDSYFCVRVKEDTRTGRRDFMSVFDRKPH